MSSITSIVLSISGSAFVTEVRMLPSLRRCGWGCSSVTLAADAERLLPTATRGRSSRNPIPMQGIVLFPVMTVFGPAHIGSGKDSTISALNSSSGGRLFPRLSISRGALPRLGIRRRGVFVLSASLNEKHVRTHRERLYTALSTMCFLLCGHNMAGFARVSSMKFVTQRASVPSLWLSGNSIDGTRTW